MIKALKSIFSSTPFYANREKYLIEAYLSEAVDLVDLEMRQRRIDRGEAPWQERNKAMLGGWA